MNRDELKQYRSIVAEIRELKENIRKNTVHDTVTGSDSHYPYIQHTISIKGMTKEAEESAMRLKKLQKRAADIKAWVDDIPDSLTRRIIRHKYIYGGKDVTWLDVVKTMYPNLRIDKQFKMTESIKKKCTRFLKKF